MSFTALLLPLRPHLTYYQYLAGGGGRGAVHCLSPQWLSLWEPDTSTQAARKTLARLGGSRLHATLPIRPRLHSRVQLFLDLLTSLDVVWLPSPTSSPQRPLPSRG